MSHTVITADSTCDLPPEVIAAYAIKIIPLYIDYPGRSYRDGTDIRPGDVFQYVNKTGLLPKTAGVPISDYIDVFSCYARNNLSVVHISLGSGFSCCYQNACLAASEFNSITVIDSQNLSSGSGHLAIEAAIMAHKGIHPDLIVDRLEELKTRIDTSFIIDTLDYLHLGGRCSSVAALGANLLNIKPSIELKEGAMHVGRKYKGNIDRCIARYVGDRLENHQDFVPERVFVTHTGCSPEIVKKVKELIIQTGHFTQIIESIASCTIACHCGPHTLGVLFLRQACEQ